MKIIGVDNFNRETIADFLVCENVREGFNEKIVTFLNAESGKYGSTYYRAVPDDHVLSRGMEDLI